MPVTPLRGGHSPLVIPVPSWQSTSCISACTICINNWCITSNTLIPAWPWVPHSAMLTVVWLVNSSSYDSSLGTVVFPSKLFYHHHHQYGLRRASLYLFRRYEPLGTCFSTKSSLCGRNKCSDVSKNISNALGVTVLYGKCYLNVKQSTISS